MRHLTIRDIAKQEIDVEVKTADSLNGFLELSERTLNLFIELVYVDPAIEDVESDVGALKSAARHWLYMSIFTFRASILLMSTGYYFEAHLLNRSLVEVLAKMMYFHTHPDKWKNFESLAAKKKASITFKAMFDEVLPGYYDEYSWMFSYVAHGGVGARIFKIKHDSAGKRTPDTGVTYDETLAGLVLNHINMFLLGFLRIFASILPEVVQKLPDDRKKEFEDVQMLLETGVHEHIKLKGGENEWHQVTRPIWKT
jgi:hypothetical protein